MSPSSQPRFSRAAASLAMVAALAAGAPAQAAVVEYADVGGIRTFQDTTTGRVWADLDARFAATAGSATPVASHDSYGGYRSALESAGFSWAFTADVMALLDTLDFPNNAGAVAVAQGYAGVMTSLSGSGGLLMGLAQNTSTPTGQRRHGLVSSGSLRSWGTFASSLDFSQTDTQSLVGLWAYMEAPAAGGGGGGAGAVPEPGGLALAAAALAALGLSARGRPSRGRRPAGR